MTSPTGPTIRELLSYRLHQVANLLSRGAEMRYRREFGVSLWEWRTVALLGGAAEAQSLNELARAAGMDKSQMSRVVAGLTGRKIVVRAVDASDARGIRLSLTAKGTILYRKLIQSAAERNDAFVGCLTTKERVTLDAIMAKLAHEARGFIQKEKQLP
jgi:DNA-binding MarR family transcriptional regulator